MLLVSGDWRDFSVTWDSRFHNETESIDNEASVYSDVWSVGTALVLSPARVDKVRIWASYNSAKDSDLSFSEPRQPRWNRLEAVNRTTRIGLALETTLYKNLKGLAGVRGDYRYTRSSRVYYQREGGQVTRLFSTERSEQDQSDRFSWGLQYDVWGVQLTGSLASNLNLDQLFGTLDVIIPL